jgi:CubicO group peptidase (beta-lactamase class C family)
VGTRIHEADAGDLDDRFHLGSNTKSMTATLAGILVEEGRLGWGSTVGEVLGREVPGLSRSLVGATLAQLLSHASGIPSDTEDMLALYFNGNAFEYNPPALRLRPLAAWKHHVVTVPEGSPFQYSNFGYVLAGSMIEKAAGTPWEELMYERIFVPMGMQTARLGPQATYGRIDAAVGHRIRPDGSIVAKLWGAAADIPPVIAPAGNANMSIRDCARWAGWNAGQGKRGPALVSPETLRDLQSIHVQTPVRRNPPPRTPGATRSGRRRPARSCRNCMPRGS